MHVDSLRVAPSRWVLAGLSFSSPKVVWLPDYVKALPAAATVAFVVSGGRAHAGLSARCWLLGRTAAHPGGGQVEEILNAQDLSR